MASLSQYQHSAGVVHSIGWHIVWCPKYRKPVLVGAVKARLIELLSAKADEREWTLEALEVMPDHVHVFVRTSPSASASYIANQFKGVTSRRLRAEFPQLRRIPTLWSKSYFVASVGRVSEATIRKYIDEQSTKPIVGVP